MHKLAFRTVLVGLPAGLAALAAQSASGDRPTVKSLPPVVVRTTPVSGDTQVDAAKVKEIRVTFSKNMADKGWSWVQISDDTQPRSAVGPHYEPDQRTCVLPVDLEPGKTYVVWLNDEKYHGFKDADGHAAVPYLLVFETKP